METVPRARALGLGTALLMLLTVAPAAAVPTTVTQQGRVVGGDGEGLGGSHSIEFTLFSDTAGTVPVWTEVLTVELDAGYYSVILGSTAGNPLDDSVLSLFPLYLGMSLDGGSLTQPLLEVTSSPYAVIAGVSTNVDGGYVDATQLSIDGTLVIDSNGNWVGGVLPGTLATIACSAGEILVWNSATHAFSCGAALTESDIEGFVTNGPLNLDAGTTLGGVAISTGDHYNTAQTITAVEGTVLNLAAATTVAGAAIATGPHFSSADAVTAMGTQDNANALNHSRYADAEAVAAMGTQDNANALNHSRYADADAVSAVTASAVDLASGTTVDNEVISTASHSHGGGIVYTRWGANSCPSGAQEVYVGQVVGSHYQHSGSGSNTLCLPPNPEYGDFDDGNQDGALLYGLEYETHGGALSQLAQNNQFEAECAVCYRDDRNVSFMLPARQSCPTGWNVEYSGYLMAQHYQQLKSEWVCVDLPSPPASPFGAISNRNGALWYATEQECSGGSFDCTGSNSASPPGYVHNRELTCTICSR